MKTIQDITKLCFLPGSLLELTNGRYNYISLLKLGLANLGVSYPSSASGWGLSGNVATGSNFIGTTNDIPLYLRANNVQVAKLDTLNHNISIGEEAMANSTPLFNTVPNVAIGWKALRLATTGYGNYCIGTQSFENLTDGRGNIGLGHQTGVAATGIYNTLVGTHASQNMTAGDYNTAFGYYAGFAISGSNNTSLGTRANQVGNNSLTAIGYYARNGDVTTGSAGTYTTAVGFQALMSIGADTGCLGIGDRTVVSNGLTNAGAIGSQASCTQQNSISIGAISGINGAASNTKVGIGTTAPSEMLHVVGNATITGTNPELIMTAGSTTTYPRITIWNQTNANGAGANLVLKNDVNHTLNLYATASGNTNTPDSALWYSPSFAVTQFVYNPSGVMRIGRSILPTTSVTMNLFGNGNVLLGGGTTDNGYKFEVAGTSKLGGVTTLDGILKLKSYTVGTLPAGAVGDVAYVTDALAPTYNATLVGGGAIVTIALHNGTNWTAH